MNRKSCYVYELINYLNCTYSYANSSIKLSKNFVTYLRLELICYIDGDLEHNFINSKIRFKKNFFDFFHKADRLVIVFSKNFDVNRIQFSLARLYLNYKLIFKRNK